MTTTCSRRSILLVSASALSGCVGGRGDDEGTTTEDGSAQTDTTTTTQDETGMTPTDDGTPTPDRREQVERLPEPSPLVGSLTAVVAASDREATAAEYGIEYRSADDSVRVAVELEPDADGLPDGYRVEEVSSFGGQVIAYVHVDDLVPLAMEDDVRRIQKPPESRTNQSAV